MDKSSELASIGGFSNHNSLLLAESSPHNDNSLPVANDNDFSSMLEAGLDDIGPATEKKIVEG